MKRHFSLFAIVFGLGLAACGDDTPYVQDGGGPQAGSYTAFVIDLVTNHTDDPMPADYAVFSGLPDPDADANNVTAYDSLFQ